MQRFSASPLNDADDPQEGTLATRKRRPQNVVSDPAMLATIDRLLAETRELLGIDGGPATHRAIFDAMAERLRASVRKGRAYDLADYAVHLRHAQDAHAQREMTSVNSVRTIFCTWADTLRSAEIDDTVPRIEIGRPEKHGGAGLIVTGIPALTPPPAPTARRRRVSREERHVRFLSRVTASALRAYPGDIGEVYRRVKKHGVRMVKTPAGAAILFLGACALGAAIANYSLFKQDPSKQGALQPTHYATGAVVARWAEQTPHAKGRGEVTREKDGSYQLTYYPVPEPRRLPDLSNVQYEWFLIDEPNGPRMKLTTAEPFLRRTQLPEGIHVHTVEYVSGRMNLDIREDGLVALTDANGAPMTRYATEVRTRDGFRFSVGQNTDPDTKELSLALPSLPILDRAELAKRLGALDVSYTGTTEIPQVQESGVVWGECLATPGASKELEPRACERVHLASQRRDDLAVIEGRMLHLRMPGSIAARPVIHVDWQVCHAETGNCEAVGDQKSALYRLRQPGTYVVYAWVVGSSLTKHHAPPSTSATHGHSLLFPWAAYHQRIRA